MCPRGREIPDITTLLGGAKISRSGKTLIKVAAAKNYKIDFIEIAYRKGNKAFTQKIKNGQKASLKNATAITVTYHTTKKPLPASTKVRVRLNFTRIFTT